MWDVVKKGLSDKVKNMEQKSERNKELAMLILEDGCSSSADKRASTKSCRKACGGVFKNSKEASQCDSEQEDKW